MFIRFLILILSVVFYGCFNESAITKITKAQSKQGLEKSIQKTAIKNESPVKPIGKFTNRKGDGEHEYGYSVSLWQQDDKIFGLIFGGSSLRLAGDSPAGLLENVKFEPKTGKFSFRAKLTLGLFSDKNHSNEPSRDVYEFNGILIKNGIKGYITTTNELCADKCLEKKKINLKRSKEMSSLMEEFQSYDDWKSDYETVLQRLGPKW